MTEDPDLADAVRRKWQTAPAELIFTLLVGLTVVGALQTVEWLGLVTDLPLPWLDTFLPYFSPFILVILVFNMGMELRVNEGRINVSYESVLMAVFIFVLFSIDLLHATVANSRIVPWMSVSFFWVAIIFLTLRSFEGVASSARNWIIHITLVISVASSGLQVLMIVISPSWGQAPPGWSSTQLFDSVYIGYLSILGLTLALFEYSASIPRKWSLGWFAIVAVLIVAAVIQRITGPQLLVAALLMLKLLCMTGFWKVRVGGVLISTFVIILVVLSVFMLWERGTTWVGIAGGRYFFDEIYGAIPGDVISGFVRRATILEGLHQFARSPLVGVGSDAASSIVIGFGAIQSVLVYLLASGGLLGAGILVYLIAYLTYRSFQSRGLSAFALPGIVVGHMLISGSVSLWWAIALYLISTGREVDFPKRRTKRNERYGS